MGKQEVIERLNNKLDEVFAFQRNFEPLTGAYMECESKASAYMTAINYVEQLDEPQKVKVKQYVADWFEEHKDFLELSLGRITPDIRTKIVQGQALSEFEKWFNNTRNEPFETIIRMKNGYEVEGETKYFVELKTLGRSYFLIQNLTMFGKIHTQLNEARENPYAKKWKSTFTEKEIKSIDERYWAFAVPVEKVEV